MLTQLMARLVYVMCHGIVFLKSCSGPLRDFIRGNFDLKPLQELSVICKEIPFAYSDQFVLFLKPLRQEHVVFQTLELS